MPNDKPIATKGSETLETNAENWLMERYGWDHGEGMPLKECVGFARTVAREMIAELRKKEQRFRRLETQLIGLGGDVPITTATVTGCADTLKKMADQFESSPRYGAGSSKVKPGEPTQ